jgi:hypothetical protein
MVNFNWKEYESKSRLLSARIERILRYGDELCNFVDTASFFQFLEELLAAVTEYKVFLEEQLPRAKLYYDDLIFIDYMLPGEGIQVLAEKEGIFEEIDDVTWTSDYHELLVKTSEDLSRYRFMPFCIRFRFHLFSGKSLTLFESL